MERLTTISKYGNPEYLWEVNSVNGCYDIYCEELLMKQIHRLAEYEDTGFTQQDIKDMHNELCLKCGNYQREHLGACNGCRWKKEEN